MPDLLGVTNPVPGYDSGVNNRSIPMPPGNTQLQNVPDLSRVGRADHRTEQQDAAAQRQGQVRYDSNFQTFLQRLKDMPQLTAVLTRLLSGKTGTVVSSGISAGLAEELGSVLGMLSMDKSQLLQFLSDQLASGARFSGPLFALLLQNFRQAESESMRTDILQFLKAYADFSSTEHIEGNLLRNMDRMARSVPASWGGRLMELMAQLQNGVAAGDRAGNLKLLQGQVLPYLSDYVGRTHDLGRARGFLTLLVLDLARYENGSQENLLQAFHQLQNYAQLKEKLGGLGEKELLTLLRSTPFARAGGEDTFAPWLTRAAAQGLRGAAGPEAQAAFRELVRAFLVNESVYMTVNHLILPLEWEGKLMFSELWVDPDAEGDAETEGEERTIRFLMKFDIESLGFFDLALSCAGQRVSLHLQCPERLTPFSKAIEGALGRIIADSGLTAQAVQVRQMERPLTVSEVFPKLFEGKDSVNVTA